VTSDSGAQPPATLIEMLQSRAQADHERVAYTFRDEQRTFGQLWRDVEALGRTLRVLGLASSNRVVMALPNGHDFFTSFYGCQRAGGVAVPIYPGSTPARLVEVANLCGASHLIVPSARAPEVLERVRALSAGVTVLTPTDLSDEPVELPAVGPEDVAFIQYTSGSTGDPKGVQLSHANLLTNVRQMIAGMEITSADRFVSWLPTYHDMGLILMTIVPFYLAAPLYLLPTKLSVPRPWLDAISRHRATFTASPDFGYRLCVRIAAIGENDYDLTSLRVALNAAEPVRASTLDGFHETFGLDDVMVAAYGLAEATVGVSMWQPSTTNRRDTHGCVSVGRPFPGIAVSILDDHDQPVPVGTAGHIVVETPAATRGYFRDPEATSALFAAPDTVRTGDIGYVDEKGYLYIRSRAKDVIIQAGRTVYPQEVEETASSVDGVRRVAAIGVDHGGIEGEQVTILAEIRPAAMPHDRERKTCVIGITNAIHDRFGFRPARVHLVNPKTIPMTTNGKLRRSELRAKYLDGRLADAVLYPPRPTRSAMTHE
jgi:acyl-CoA synthetase (AMP-forming)/AMP-acid ligase II